MKLVTGAVAFRQATFQMCTILQQIKLTFKQTSASECVLVSILAARALAIQKLKKQSPTADEGVLLSKLMAYCSKEAHSCLEKGSMIAFTKLRILDTDES